MPELHEVGLLRYAAGAAMVLLGVPAAGQDFPAPGDAEVVEVGDFAVQLQRNLRLRVEIVSDEEGPALFFRVSSARFKADSILVANSGSGEIRLFDAAGRHLRSFGGLGGGPGEFRTLGSAWSRVDQVIATEFSPRGVVIFDAAGQYQRGVGLSQGPGVLWPTPIGVIGESIIAINGQVFERGEMGTGLVRPPFEILTFALASGVLETYALTFPGTEFWVTVGSGQVTTKSLLGPETLYAVGSDVVYLASTDRYEVWCLSAGGEVLRVLRHEAPTRRVTNAEIRRRRSERVEQIPPGRFRDQTRRALEAMPAPDQAPVIDNLVAGSDGTLWVRTVGDTEDALRAWHVFDSAGQPTRLVWVPTELTITDAREGMVLGIWRDEFDVESIRTYDLTR